MLRSLADLRKSWEFDTVDGLVIAVVEVLRVRAELPGRRVGNDREFARLRGSHFVGARRVPAGSVRGERVNLTRLVLGCIEAKHCKKICVGKLKRRSTQCIPFSKLKF